MPKKVMWPQRRRAIVGLTDDIAKDLHPCVTIAPFLTSLQMFSKFLIAAIALLICGADAFRMVSRSSSMRSTSLSMSNLNIDMDGTKTEIETILQSQSLTPNLNHHSLNFKAKLYSSAVLQTAQATDGRLPRRVPRLVPR